MSTEGSLVKFNRIKSALLRTAAIAVSKAAGTDGALFEIRVYVSKGPL